MKLSLLCIHISLNIDPRILNPNTPEYPFPSAVHIYPFQITQRCEWNLIELL